jgi:hypothetical protein
MVAVLRPPSDGNSGRGHELLWIQTGQSVLSHRCRSHESGPALTTPSGSGHSHGLPMTCIQPLSHFSREPRCPVHIRSLLLQQRTPLARPSPSTARIWPSRQQQSPPGCCSPSPAARHRPNQRMVTAWCHHRRQGPLASQLPTAQLALRRSPTPRHQCPALPTPGRGPHQPALLLHPPRPATHRQHRPAPLRPSHLPRHQPDQRGAGRRDSNHHPSNHHQRHRQSGNPFSHRRKPTMALRPKRPLHQPSPHLLAISSHLPAISSPSPASRSRGLASTSSPLRLRSSRRPMAAGGPSPTPTPSHRRVPPRRQCRGTDWTAKTPSMAVFAVSSGHEAKGSGPLLPGILPGLLDRKNAIHGRFCCEQLTRSQRFGPAAARHPAGSA